MRTGRDERARVRGAQRGSVSDLEALFRITGRARFAPPTSSRTTPVPPRTSPRSPSWLRGSRPVRPQAAVRPVAPSDRRQPSDRLDARPTAALGGGALGVSTRARPRGGGETLALAALSPEHRAVVVMRYLLEFTPGEIAEALDLARNGQLEASTRSRRTRRRAVKHELERIEVPNTTPAGARGESSSPRSPGGSRLNVFTLAARGGDRRRARRASRSCTEPAGPRRSRRGPRGRRRRARAAALFSFRRRAASRRVRRGRLGRSAGRLEATARRRTGRRAGRRSGASSSRRARTSWPHSSRTATSAGRSPAQASRPLAGPASRPIRGSPTSIAPDSASSPETAPEIDYSSPVSEEASRGGGAEFVLGLATPRDVRVVDVVSGRTRWRRARRGYRPMSRGRPTGAGCSSRPPLGLGL